MNAPPSVLADVSDPRLYRDDSWREHFARRARATIRSIAMPTAPTAPTGR